MTHNPFEQVTVFAPVSIGNDAVTGSGTIVTDDVGPGDLALSRTPQTNKAGRGAKLMSMLRARKMKRTQ